MWKLIKKAFVKAITYCAYEQDDDEDDEEEGNEQMDANQLEKRLSHVIRNKFCESCLKEGHFQFGKRETSESGCQTEFNPTRRKLREGLIFYWKKWLILWLFGQIIVFCYRMYKNT